MVTIVDYQPEWPARFSEAVAELRTVFSGLPVQLEHIGSTSVVGLCAKPILDILLGAPELSAIEERIQALAELGYRYRPEHEAEIPDRRYFVRQAGRGPKVHLHGVVVDGDLWRRHLAFRDALRSNPEILRQYGDLKRRLALEHGNDRPAYTAAKGPFIMRVLAGLNGS